MHTCSTGALFSQESRTTALRSEFPENPPGGVVGRIPEHGEGTQMQLGGQLSNVFNLADVFLKDMI